MRQLLTLIPLFFLKLLNAQDFEKDMQLLNKKFVSAENISFRIDYVLKASHSENSDVINRNSGRYVKQNQIFLSAYDRKATLVTPDKTVFLDGDDHAIRVKKTSEAKNNVSPADFLVQLKQYNKNVSEVKHTLLAKHLIKYDVILKDIQLFPISHYELTIDLETGYLRQMTLFYRKPLHKDADFNITGTELPRLEILFSGFNQNTIFSKNELDINYYYNVSSGKLTPSTNFKGYIIKEIN